MTPLTADDFEGRKDKMGMTKEKAIQISINREVFFAKFVKTESGYFIGDSDTHHNQIFPADQKPISAGFVGIIAGKSFSLRRMWSSTLELGPDENDLDGLEKFFGFPGTKEE